MTAVTTDTRAASIFIIASSQYWACQMVQIDSRNSQFRQQINGLHENVTLLREQVNRLERKVTKQRGSSAQ